MKNYLIIFFVLINSYLINAQNTLQNIDSLLQAGNYKTALKILKNLTDKPPLILNKLGDIYKQTGNYNKAIYTYKKSLEQENSLLIKEKLAKAYKSYGNIEKAIVLFKELLLENPNNDLLKYYVAKLFYTKKKYDDSKSLFQSLQNNDSLNPNYTYYLARIFHETKNESKAKKYYLKTIKLDSIFIKPYFRLVKIYHKQKQYDSTLYYLRKGLKIRPKYKSLNQIKAKIQFDYGKHTNVIKQVELLDSLKISSNYYKQLQGLSYFNIKDYKKSKEILQKILLNKKANEKTVYYLGLSHKELKEYKLAILYINLSINMQHSVLEKEFYQLGLIYKELKNPKEAILAFKKSLKEKTYNPNALYELAVLSESYYKDKTIALGLYQEYLGSFENNNKKKTDFIKQQINKIKTELFYKK